MINEQEAFLIRLVNSCGGYVFGGFVRDKLAEEPVNDMDVRFPKLEQMEKFIMLLLARFSKVQIESKKEDQDNYSHYHVMTEGLPFAYIDCTFGDVLNYHGYLAKPDCDVNMLTIDGSGSIGTNVPLYQVKPVGSMDVTTAIVNACKKRFRALPGAEPKRIEKMLAKGWTQVL